MYVGDDTATLTAEGGRLADIAPTMVALLGIAQPEEMTGKNLISH